MPDRQPRRVNPLTGVATVLCPHCSTPVADVSRDGGTVSVRAGEFRAVDGVWQCAEHEHVPSAS